MNILPYATFLYPIWGWGSLQQKCYCKKYQFFPFFPTLGVPPGGHDYPHIPNTQCIVNILPYATFLYPICGWGSPQKKCYCKKYPFSPIFPTLGVPLGVMTTRTYLIPNVFWTSYHMLHIYTPFRGGDRNNKKVIARNINFYLFFILWGPPQGFMTTRTYLIPNVSWISYHMLHFYTQFGGGDLNNKNVIVRNIHFYLFFILWGSPRGSWLPTYT